MDFLADENFPLDAVRRLRDAGHDVAAVVQESPGISDEEILERAAREGRVILTFDRDYGSLLFEQPSRQPPLPAGLVYFRFDPSRPEEPADFLLYLLDHSDSPVIDHLTVVERDRARQRPLRG